MRRTGTLAGRALAAALLGVLAMADAQPGRLPRIGWLGNGKPAPQSPPVQAFRQGLQQRGWSEGQTVAIESRWAEGDFDRLPALVDDLVRSKVDVIVADPVTAGFVKSLGRPGGNLTGIASEFDVLVTKQLQLLKDTVPALTGVAVLHRPEVAPALLATSERAAREPGLVTRPIKTAGVEEFEAAFSTARRDGAGAIQVLPSPFFSSQRRALIGLASRHRLPAIYEFREYVEDGGLMSYGPSINAMFRESAGHVDRILKGARPGDRWA